MTIEDKQSEKLIFVEETMKLMKKYKVTAMKLGELEMSMPPEYDSPVAEDDKETMSDEELLFWSANEGV